MSKRRTRTPGLGYSRQTVRINGLEMIGQWLIVSEAKPEVFSEVLAVVRQGTQHQVRGTILKAGPEAELEDLHEGDEIIYEEWAGGRWALKDDEGFDVSVLIMSVDSVLAVVK